MAAQVGHDERLSSSRAKIGGDLYSGCLSGTKRLNNEEELLLHLTVNYQNHHILAPG